MKITLKKNDFKDTRNTYTMFFFFSYCHNIYIRQNWYFCFVIAKIAYKLLYLYQQTEGRGCVFFRKGWCNCINTAFGGRVVGVLY